MTIKIVNYKYHPKGRAAGYCVQRKYSPLGSPFPVKPWGPYERGETIPLYEEWLYRKYYVERDTKIVFTINKLYRQWLRDGELILVCGCKPLDCHADVIAKLLTEIFIDKLI